MMRIITGTARGVRLLTLPGEETTRPTTERVKEAVFSAIQFELEGRRVLDLFAGSGQMGLEALSRGAVHATFVDSSKEACEIVKQNAKNARLMPSSQILNTSAETFCERCKDTYDVVFLDPPYKANLLPSLLRHMPRLMRVGGVTVCETDDKTELPSAVDGENGLALTLQKDKRYGKTRVWFYRLTETAT